MNVMTLVFTKSIWSPVSWLVRWALPRSRFAWALSSHVLVIDGEFAYEAIFPKGVQRIPMNQAMSGATMVRTINYAVLNKAAGIAWLVEQEGKPYDLKGAVGASITPDRDWANPAKWFCYELAAGALQAAGLDVFSELNHITEIPLLALKS